jgi:hypothetical protein
MTTGSRNPPRRARRIISPNQQEIWQLRLHFPPAWCTFHPQELRDRCARARPMAIAALVHVVSRGISPRARRVCEGAAASQRRAISKQRKDQT